MKYDYELRRSRRRTLSLEITRDATLLVRAPMRMAKRDIEHFIDSKQDWIEIHMRRQEARKQAHPEPDEARWAELLRQAKAYIPGRVEYYALLMGVKPTAVRFSRARTRFGSCSAKNSITFSIRLMDYPLTAVDYVIVHELAHIRYKNHGSEFYRFIASVMPDYKQRERPLRQ